MHRIDKAASAGPLVLVFHNLKVTNLFGYSARARTLCGGRATLNIHSLRRLLLEKRNAAHPPRRGAGAARARGLLLRLRDGDADRGADLLDDPHARGHLRPDTPDQGPELRTQDGDGRDDTRTRFVPAPW